MTIVIPAWLLWTLGGIVVFVVLVFAFVGVVFWRTFNTFRGW